MVSRQLSIIFNWNSTNLCKYFPSLWWIWCLGWVEGVVHLLQKDISYLQNSIRQSLLEDFFLFCTVGLYSAVGSPRVTRQGAGARMQMWFRESLVKDWVFRDGVSMRSLRKGFPPGGLHRGVTWPHAGQVLWMTFSVQPRLQCYWTAHLCVRGLLLLLALQSYPKDVNGLSCPNSYENKGALWWDSSSRRAWE